MDKIQTTDCYVPVDFLLWVFSEGYTVRTYTDFTEPDDAIWVKGVNFNKTPADFVSTNQLFELYIKAPKSVAIEKKEGVIVLTPAEFEKEVSERVQSAPFTQ